MNEVESSMDRTLLEFRLDIIEQLTIKDKNINGKASNSVESILSYQIIGHPLYSQLPVYPRPNPNVKSILNPVTSPVSQASGWLSKPEVMICLREMVGSDNVPVKADDAQLADLAATLDVEDDGFGGGAVNYHQLLRCETVRNLIYYMETG